MSVKIFSCMPFGLDGRLVEVEADILRGMAAFNIVGLGDAAVQEAKERVRSAIKNSGFDYPQQKKVINLAPADLRKHGPQFDLPIAVGLLAAAGQVQAAHFKDAVIAGELALDGSVRPIRGALTMALFARKNGYQKIIIPEANYAEASLVKDLQIIPINNLREINSSVDRQKSIDPQSLPGQTSVKTAPHPPLPGNSALLSNPDFPDLCDFSDITGQESAKRAITIAVAGQHHCLLTGPPGVGKTMLAKAIPGIMPNLNEQEMFEVTQIFSLAGLLNESRILISQRPFRQVHHTCSLYSLVGGGTVIKPGEISLAHRGVLFLDEIAEFPRGHLESLRQPLEDKEITVSRTSGSLKFPAHFMLIAGMNPCPCGYSGDPRKPCTCLPYRIISYRKKLSGPIMDRIDMVIELSRQSISQPIGKKNCAAPGPKISPATSAQIKKQITAARKIQAERYKSPLILNSCISHTQIKKHCLPTSDGADLLKEAEQKFSLSARAYHQILKVSRTICDLSSRDRISVEDLAEAIRFRTSEGR